MGMKLNRVRLSKSKKPNFKTMNIKQLKQYKEDYQKESQKYIWVSDLVYNYQ